MYPTPQNPHLQYLFTHPQIGYLYPHRYAIAAFSLPNEYQLSKHRPHLRETQHYLKLRGDDHIDRLYYTLAGLFLLADLIGTSAAAQFKQDLIRHTQSGAIVPATPTDLYSSPSSPSDLSAASIPTVLQPEPIAPTAPLTPADPAYRLSQYLSPGIEQVVERSIAAQSAPPGQSPQETANLIFQAQQIAAAHIFAAQKISTSQQKAPEVHVHLSPWRRLDDWLNQQDVIALTFITVCLMTLATISGYFFTATLSRPVAPQAQPQNLER